MQKKHDIVLSKAAFVTSCINQDLGILKLLVEEARSKSKDPIDVEQIAMNKTSACDWMDWLYEANTFVKRNINQDSEFCKYWNRVYNEEVHKDFSLSNDGTNVTLASKTDELVDAKALYEIQMMDGLLNVNMEMNATLHLTKNLELMLCNNKKHFSQSENIRTSVLNLIEYNGDPTIECVRILLSQPITLDINFEYEFDETLVKIFQRAMNHENDEVLVFLINRFPYLTKEKALFQNCEITNIHKVLKKFSSKFQASAKDEIVQSAFLDSVKDGRTDESSLWLDKYPNLMIEELLLKAHSIHDIYQMFETIPAMKNRQEHLLKFLSNTDLMGNPKPRRINIKLKDKHKNFPIHLTAMKGHLELLKILIEKGANVFAVNALQETALHLAAFEGHFEIAKILIENNADVNAKEYYNGTPLHKAAVRNHFRVAELLLQNGAEVNAKNTSKETPLHYAAISGSHEVTEVLLKHGANRNLKDYDNKTALELALQKTKYCYGYSKKVLDLLKNE